MTTSKINPIISEAARTIKDKQVGIVIPKEIACSMPKEHLPFVQDKNVIQIDVAQLEKYVAQLEKYLEKNPNDIEVRTQVARFKEMMK